MQYINNTNILQFLKLETKLATTKLQLVQYIDNYCCKYSNNYYRFDRRKKTSCVKKLLIQKYINYINLEI